MAEYGIWLSFNNQEEGFQIPVNPRSIEMSDGNKGATYDIAKLGEINVIKNPKLTTYSFSSMFPNQVYPFVTADILLQPKVYVEYIIKWMASNRPIRFIFTGASFDLNEAVSLEKFDWKEVAGSSGDIEYTLGLKKYVFYAAQNVSVVTQTQPNGTQTQVIQKEPKARENDRQPAKTHTLVSGESLWTVAKKGLGNGSRWKEIQQLNNISDAELKSLPIGKVLKLPQDTGGGVLV